MTLTFDDVYAKLISWGYKATREPKEQRQPNEIELKYDMSLKPSDITCTEYAVTHQIELTWLAPTPGGIAAQVVTLLGKLGHEYSSTSLHFEMSALPLKRNNGTMYIAGIAVSWVTFQIVDI